MRKKNYKLIKWKVSGMNTKILIATFLSLYFCVQLSFSTDILVWPKEIKFNYDTTAYINDAINLKKDKDNPVPVPEWIKGEQENEKCAYIKGQSNRKIQVKFDSNSDNMNFLIKATVITGEGIGAVCEAFVAECDLNNEFITLDLTGSIPASVGKRTFQWKWEATALPINSPYCPIVCEPCTTSHTYYTLLDVPQDPMAEPWINVLDYACDWTNGKTTTSEVIYSLTVSLHNSGVKYDPVGYYMWPYSYTHLNLTLLLHDLDSCITAVKIDCRAFANFLQVLTNALGVTGGYNRIGWYFNTNYIWPAGWHDEIETLSWSYHMVGWYNSKVADASIYIDIDEYPTSPPHTWNLAVGNMSLTNYLDKLTEGSPGSVATGVCTVY